MHTYTELRDAVRRHAEALDVEPGYYATQSLEELHPAEMTYPFIFPDEDRDVFPGVETLATLDRVLRDLTRPFPVSAGTRGDARWDFPHRQVKSYRTGITVVIGDDEVLENFETADSTEARIAILHATHVRHEPIHGEVIRP